MNSNTFIKHLIEGNKQINQKITILENQIKSTNFDEKEIILINNNETEYYNIDTTNKKIIVIHFIIILCNESIYYGVFENKLYYNVITNKFYSKYESIYLEQQINQCKITYNYENQNIYINIQGENNKVINCKGFFNVLYY